MGEGEEECNYIIILKHEIHDFQKVIAKSNTEGNNSITCTSRPLASHAHVHRHYGTHTHTHTHEQCLTHWYLNLCYPQLFSRNVIATTLICVHNFTVCQLPK